MRSVIRANVRELIGSTGLGLLLLIEGRPDRRVLIVCLLCAIGLKMFASAAGWLKGR